MQKHSLCPLVAEWWTAGKHNRPMQNFRCSITTSTSYTIATTTTWLDRLLLRLNGLQLRLQPQQIWLIYSYRSSSLLNWRHRCNEPLRPKHFRESVSHAAAHTLPPPPRIKTRTGECVDFLAGHNERSETEIGRRRVRRRGVTHSLLSPLTAVSI